MTNEKAFKRFLWGVLIASTIIHLLGCMPAREVETTAIYQGGCVYTQYDTIIENDTLYYWK